MEAVKINIEPLADLKNTHIAYFEGDFDGSVSENLGDFQNFIDSATPGTTVILDFSKLNFLNSYAIGHLVAWHTHLGERGGSITIVGTNKNVEDIFDIVGISKLFKCYPDISAALQALKNPAV